LDQIPELAGEPRKAAISQAERALEELDEQVRCNARDYLNSFIEC
jgi:ribosome recycling factor